MPIPAAGRDEFWTETRIKQLLSAVRAITGSGDRALLIPTRDGIRVIRQKQSNIVEVT